MECKTCKYHDDFTWVCFNPDAEDRADFTDNEHVCDKWEEKDWDRAFDEAIGINEKK